jgi:RimJ/RimL family protein N-acetyltransferase
VAVVDGRLGPELAWTPARSPDDRPLRGRRVTLEPLDPTAHARGLYAAAHPPDGGGDPHLWDYLSHGPFADFDAFAGYVEASVADPAAHPYAIVGHDAGPQGIACYLRIFPEHGSIEIGSIWFSPALQRTPAATEAIYLLARHAFEELGNRRLEWKCNALNERSRRAAERLGFTFEGVFRQHLIVKGRNRDTAWYSMLDHEWPGARAAFEAWLDPANFDSDGRQRQTLAELRQREARNG